MTSVPKVSIGDGDTLKTKEKKVHRKWYNFQVLSSTISILSGSFSIDDMRFKFASRGRQAAPCAIIAIVLGRLFEPKLWTFHHVNQTINNGDKLYRISKTRHRLNNDDYMSPAMVHSEFFIDDYKCSVCVKQSGIYGDLFSVDMSCPHFTDGLQRFFKLNTCGVITAQGSSIAIWRNPNYGFLYFDPSSCNERGERITSNGVACIMRFKCLTDLQELFLSNMNRKLDTRYSIDIVTLIYVDLINRDAVTSNQFAVDRIVPKNLDTIELDSPQLRYPERTSKSPKILSTRTVITKEPLAITISNYNIDTKFAAAPVIDQNHFNTGYPYYDLKVNIPTTFVQLTDDCAILYGFTHEGSGMYKGKGGQSVANCIMAIGMKKVHPVSTWQRTTIDEILALGDALHIEKKGTMDTVKSLNAADFDNTEIIIEEKKYHVNVDLLTIVGTISSKLPSILNIKQALEEFFLINKDGIIESSSMANAVWTDDDFFYMFNPRECNDLGIKVTEGRGRARAKSKKKDSGEIEKRANGQSCVIRHPSIDALVAQFLKNVDSGKKNDRFIMRHLTIMDDIPGTRPWNDFQPGENGKTWVLSGTLSNESGEFGDNSRGIQGIAMPIVALVNAMEIPPNEWTREILDCVVREGDDYYNWCIGPGDEEIKLSLRKLKKHLYVKNRRVKINIQESSQIGDIKATSDTQLPNLAKGIRQFFDTHQFGIVQVKDLSVAIWKFDKVDKVKYKSGKKTTNETSYYCFDANPRGKIGQRDVNEDEIAAACVIRVVDPIQLARRIEMNIDHTAMDNDEFLIHSIEVEFISDPMTADEIENDKAVPVRADLNAYAEMGDDGAYLNGNFDQSNIMQFKPRTRNKQQAANALVTLAMCQLHSPFLWSREVVDDILKLGDKITEKNLINLPTEQDEEGEEITIEPLRDYLLPNEIDETFNIGVNRVTVSVDEVIGTRPVENLIDILKEFFVNNSMGILRQQDTMLPIWIESNIFFTMDPTNRFQHTSKEQNGTATVFWFTSLSSLATHIQQFLIDASRDIVIDAVQLENEYKTRLAENIRPMGPTLTENSWYNFAKKIDGVWELVGNVPIDDGQLSFGNTDDQSAAVAIISIIFSKVYEPRQWTQDILDEVVISGNKLHEKSIARLGDDVTSPRVNQILTEFFLSDRRLNITIRDCVQTGKIDEESLRFQDFKSGLKNFFHDNISGAITLASKLNVAIWKNKDYYYCLIPGVSQSASQSTLTKPRVVRFSDIELIVNELKPFADINDDYEIHGVDVTDWNKLPPWKFDPSPAIRPSNLPSLNAYKQLQGDARAILRGGIHEESDIFSKTTKNHRSAANCIVAVGMSVIRNPVTWTKKTLDDILVIGYNVHSESLKVHPEMQKLKPPDVIRIFRIGVNVLTADVDKLTLSGQVAAPSLEPEIKGRKKPRDKKPLKVKGKKKKRHRDISSPPPTSPSILLEEGLKIFFENNHAGILMAGRLMVAIWKEQGIYFIYDPHKRSDQGLADEDGVACIMWFACIDPFYALIFGNIDVTDRFGRYVIYRTIIRTTIMEPLPCPVGFQPSFDTTHPPISISCLRKITTVALETLSEYFCVDNELSVLLGTTHICSSLFDLSNRGFQSTAIAAVAIVVGILHVPSTWTAQLIDSILKYGDILHRDSVRISRSGARTLSPSELLNVFIVGDFKASIFINQNTTAGILLADDLAQALMLFFRNNCAGILHTQNLAVAVMQHYGKFYLFNPSECDKFGNSSCNGAACIAKCDSIMRLVLLFVNNCNYRVPCVYTVNTVNVLNLQFFSDTISKTPRKCG